MYYYEKDNTYHFFWANQQKVNSKIYSLTRGDLTVNGHDWHILEGNDEKIVFHCLTWTGNASVPESHNMIQFSHRYLSQCANFIYSFWFHTEFRFSCQHFADWSEKLYALPKLLYNFWILLWFIEIIDFSWIQFRKTQLFVSSNEDFTASILIFFHISKEKYHSQFLLSFQLVDFRWKCIYTYCYWLTCIPLSTL